MACHENMKTISTNCLRDMTRVYSSILLSNKCFTAYYFQFFISTIAHEGVCN